MSKQQNRYVLMSLTLSLLFFCSSCFDTASKHKKFFESDQCAPLPSGQQVLFGGVPWGGNRDQVIVAMGKQPTYAQEGMMVFNDEVAGRPVSVVFTLVNNQVTRGKYVFTLQHDYYNKYIEEFRAIEEILTQRYGDPLVSDTIWYNNMFKYVQKDYGLAISLGQMSMLAGRKIGCVRLKHSLSGGDGHVNHELEYINIRMRHIQPLTGGGLQF